VEQHAPQQQDEVGMQQMPRLGGGMMEKRGAVRRRESAPVRVAARGLPQAALVRAVDLVRQHVQQHLRAHASLSTPSIIT
jgi:hypothetical protein